MPRRRAMWKAARALLSDAGLWRRAGAGSVRARIGRPRRAGRGASAAVAGGRHQRDITSIPESVYYGSDNPDQNWLGATLGITGWGSRPYPQFYLDVMLVCDAKWNESHFCDPELDQLAATGRYYAGRAGAHGGLHGHPAHPGRAWPGASCPTSSPNWARSATSSQGFNLKAFAGRTDLAAISPARDRRADDKVTGRQGDAGWIACCIISLGPVSDRACRRCYK